MCQNSSKRSNNFSYIQEFIEVGGLECLSNLLGVLKCNLSADDAISLTLNIIKSLLNSQIGQNAVLRYEKLLCTLALLAGIVVGKSKILVLQILGGLCLVQDGREKILASFTETQSVALEKTCFQVCTHNFNRVLCETLLSVFIIFRFTESNLAIDGKILSRKSGRVHKNCYHVLY